MAKPIDLTPSFPLTSMEEDIQIQEVTSFSDFVGEQSINVPMIIRQNFMQSANFIKGSAGWRFEANGDLEANNGTFRGSLIGNSLDIPDTTSSNSFHIDSDGNVWWGATTLANSLASIKKDGIATFIGASTLDILSTTVFEDVNRFGINAVIGSGAINYGNQGVQIRTGTTATSSARHRWGGMADVHGIGVIYSITFSVTLTNSACDAYFGSGTPTVSGSSITFTDRHIGFKIVGNSLYATMADGSTETVSSVLTSVSNAVVFELIFKIKTGAVDFWWRKGNSAISSVTTLTATLPSASSFTQQCCTNKGTTNGMTFQLYATSLKR